MAGQHAYKPETAGMSRFEAMRAKISGWLGKRTTAKVAAVQETAEPAAASVPRPTLVLKGGGVVRSPLALRNMPAEASPWSDGEAAKGRWMIVESPQPAPTLIAEPDASTLPPFAVVTADGVQSQSPAAISGGTETRPALRFSAEGYRVLGGRVALQSSHANSTVPSSVTQPHVSYGEADAWRTRTYGEALRDIVDQAPEISADAIGVAPAAEQPQFAVPHSGVIDQRSFI